METLRKVLRREHVHVDQLRDRLREKEDQLRKRLAEQDAQIDTHLKQISDLQQQLKVCNCSFIRTELMT